MGKRRSEEDVPRSETMQIELPTAQAVRLLALAQGRGMPVGDLVRLALANLARRITFYNLDTTLAFGKYHGEALETVIRGDPSYVAWALKSLDAFAISNDALALLEQMEKGQ